MSTLSVNKIPTNNIFLLLISSTAILCFMAIYNGYPYVFNNDTAVYISQAYQETAGVHRPILYGLFVRYTSLGKTLWLTVIVQAFFISYIIHCYFSYFSSKTHSISGYLSFITFITFCMSGSFYTGYLMPDVFTALALSSLGLLLFIEKLDIKDFAAISVLIVISLGMHNANIYIFLGVLIVIMAGFFFRSVRQIYSKAGIRLKRLLYLFVLAIIAYIFSSALHHYNRGEFKSSRVGLFYFMGNLVKMGIIDNYLDDNCATKHYSLCQYKDSIPNAFLWDPASPINKNGGWEANKDEYSTIIKDILTTPKYSMSLIYESGINTLKQFSNFDAGPFLTGSGALCIPTEFVKSTLGSYYPEEFSSFSGSRQSENRISFQFMNFIQELAFGIFIFLYIMVLLYRKMSLRYRMLIVFILLCLVVNAWIFGTFSHASGDRYQSHVIWLLPLPLFLYLSEYIKSYKRNIKTFVSL